MRNHLLRGLSVNASHNVAAADGVATKTLKQVILLRGEAISKGPVNILVYFKVCPSA
jgi:hypothetical protein